MALSQKTKDFLSSLSQDEQAQLLQEMGFNADLLHTLGINKPEPKPDVITADDIAAWAMGKDTQKPKENIPEKDQKIIDDIVKWSLNF